MRQTKQRNSHMRVIVMGAAGRDFHNFNMLYRDDERVRVIAFTAAQIPGIGGRCYPPSLAGPRYPNGIPILDESALPALLRDDRIDEVLFAYSDLPHAEVMHKASLVLANGADFKIAGPGSTMLTTHLPVIAISAVRTGCGKSQTARYVSRRLRQAGYRVAVLRHPMPYGDLARQAVQRFATRDDLDRADCTIEEREEYEPHIAVGNVVFAGIDYAAILKQAEREADILLWDGGNNDFPFLLPDLHVVLADALRPNQLDTHHPGETVLRMADIVAINKVDAAAPGDVAAMIQRTHHINPDAEIIRVASPVTLDDAQAVRDRRALVVEDGPTITHGGMAHGAGLVAAMKAGAATIVDPRPFAAPAIADTFRKYPHIGPVLPAMGYNGEQIAALKATIEASDAEVVVAATPIDIASLISINRPVVRVRYELAEDGEAKMAAAIDRFLAGLKAEE